MSKYSVNEKNPIHAWIPSRDTSGNGTATITDLIASNSGTLTNMDPATDWVPDTDAGGVRALDFDGSNDLVNCGVLSGSITNEFSISFWIKPRSSVGNASRVFEFGNSDGNFLITTPGGFVFQIRTTDANRVRSAFSSGLTYPSPTWRHFVCTAKAATSVSVFRDAVSLALTDVILGGTTLDVSTAFIIGNRQDTGRPFNGLIDDVRIFNSILTLADAQYLYASGLGRGITAGSGIIPILRQHYAAQGAR